MLLFVMALLVATPVVFWVRTLVPGLPLGAYLYAAGRVLALTGFVFIFLQYALSSKIRWIERDIGLDQLFGIHRTSGVVGLVLVAIHPIFLFLPDFLRGDLPTMPPLKILGAVTLLILGTAAGAALLYRRLHLTYETWKAIHRVAYAVLPLGFAHALLLGSDISRAPLRALWLLFAGLYLAIVISKVWKWASVRRHPFRVAQVLQETYDTWSLHFQGPHVDYKPGQFLIVQLVRDGKVSEPHPFTISSSPTDEHLSITVKSLGDFTSTVSATKTTDTAFIDAPYGAFSFLNHDAPDLLFVAGGIGITPFMSMLRYIRDTGLRRNIVLICGNKREQDIPFRAELDSLQAEIRSLKVVHVMSSQDDWPGARGYVDRAKLSGYVTNLANAEVFLCGPPAMMASVIKALTGLGVPKSRIHYERFALR
jgi:predicted ferric reductase